MKILQMQTDREGLTKGPEYSLRGDTQHEADLNLKPDSTIFCVLFEHIPDMPDGYRLERPDDREHEKPDDARYISVYTLMSSKCTHWIKAMRDEQWDESSVYCVPENWQPDDSNCSVFLNPAEWDTVTETLRRRAALHEAATDRRADRILALINQIQDQLKLDNKPIGAKRGQYE